MYWRKWFPVLMLLFLTILAIPRPAKADTVFTLGLNTYRHDGKSIAIDVAPRVQNGRTIVPVRYLAESCGAVVGWNPSTCTVTLTGGQTIIQLVIGSKQEMVNGQVIEMDVAPVTINGRTMLPARWVAEKLTRQVSWDAKNNTVTIFPRRAVIQMEMENVRQGPGLQYAVLGMLSRNTVFNAVYDSNGWYSVDLPGGKTGWVAGWLTAATSNAATHNLSFVMPPPVATAGNSGADKGLPDNGVPAGSPSAPTSGNNGTTGGSSTTSGASPQPVSNGGGAAKGTTGTAVSDVQPPAASSGGTVTGTGTGAEVSRGGAQLSPDLFSGPGVWTDIYTNLPGAGDLARFSAAGVKRIYLEVATSYSGFPRQWQDWIDTLVPEAHRAGIRVIGWVYTRLQDPVSDARLIDQVSNYQTPAGEHLDAVAADIEELPEDNTAKAQTMLDEFAACARNGLRAGCPLLVITYPPQQRPDYPFAGMSRHFDGIVLMDYWHINDCSYSKDDVEQYVSQSVAALRQMGCAAPIEVALEGCDIGAGMIRSGEMAGAVAGARASGVCYSLYCYNTSGKIWNAFAG